MAGSSPTISHGDCVGIMDGMTPDCVDLVYLDPPFFTQKNHSLSGRRVAESYQFTDTWESLDEYLNFMRRALHGCRRVLRNTGSVFLHCDRSASHHLRLLLDEVFGASMFQSEIIWAYRRWSNPRKGLLNAHQTIYFYSKTTDFKFNATYTDYSPTTNLDQILQRRVRDDRGKAVYDRDEDGETILGPEKRGVPLSDVWSIPFLNPKARERTGYPTQKPVILLERLISIASDPGDVVLDPFCGSGTTLVAAQLTGRSAIGIDASLEAVRLAQRRVDSPFRTDSALLEQGSDAYRTKDAVQSAILESMRALPVQRNSGIDGFLARHGPDGPIAVRIQRPTESIEHAARSLISAATSKKCGRMVLVRTHRQNEAQLWQDNPLDDERVLLVDAHDLVISSWLEQLPASLVPRHERVNVSKT